MPPTDVAPVTQPREVAPVKPEAAGSTAVDNLRDEATGDANSAQAREQGLAARRTGSNDNSNDNVALNDLEIVDPSTQPVDKPNEEIDQKAKALKEAIDHKKYGVSILGIGLDDPEIDKIRRILDPLSPEERKAVEKRFQELYDPSRPYDPANSASSKLRLDLASKLGAESTNFRQIEAMLDRRSGATNDAGQAMEALAKIAKDPVVGEAQLRGVFSTLNAKDSERLQKEFEQKYGKTIDQAMQDAKVSPETLAFVEVFRKGSDKRTADDLVKLANLAMDGSTKAVWRGLRGAASVDDVDIKQFRELFKDVLAGSSPAAVEARRILQQDPNFEKKFADAFKDSSGKVDPELRDYVVSGGPSLARIVDENMQSRLGFLTNNPESVSLATQNVTPTERENFTRGRALAGRENDSKLTAEERTALDYYNRTHESLTRGAGSKTWLVASWEANILYGKDNIISNMAATHEDGWLSDSHTADAILTAAENLSEKDWKLLNDKTEKGTQFRADIAASLDKFAPEEKERILALLDAKTKAGSHLLSQDIRRGFTDAVDDKATTDWLGGGQARDAANIVDGILNLSATDIGKYKNDQAFRGQVDKTVSDSLRGSDQLLAKRLLEKVQNLPDGEKLKPDPIDQVLIDKVKDAKPDQILRNIQAAYKEKDATGQTLHERLKSGQPLSEMDQALAKIIEVQADKAISNGLKRPQNSADNPNGRKPMVEEFLETGKLPLYLMKAVGYPLVDVLADVPSATQKDLTDLRGMLTTEQRKILDAAIAQKDDAKGAVRLEDKLRSFVLGDDSKPEQFKEQLKKMTETEKVELKRAYAAKYGSEDKPVDLDRDMLSKLDKTQQAEFTKLLSTGAREARQSFYDNLRIYTDRSGITADGTEANMERALRQQQDAMEQYQRVYQTLPKEKQELLDQYFNESLKQYVDSKDNLSELAINAAITATALAAAPFSAGLSLQTIGLIAAGGGAFQVAARAAMMGSDFDASGENVVKEFVNGGAAAALNFLGAKEIDAIMASTQNAGKIFGAYLKANGVNEAATRAAAVAAGFSMDILTGGTIGAVTSVGTEIILAPVNGVPDWNSLSNNIALSFALGAVIPVTIKGVLGAGQAAGRGADKVINVVRGDNSVLFKTELNSGYYPVDKKGFAVPVPIEGLKLDSDIELIETKVVNGRRVNNAGEPIKTSEGREIGADGRPIPASVDAPNAVPPGGEGFGKPRKLFDPSHRSIDEVPANVRAEAVEARTLYSRLAAENPNAPLVDAKDILAEWRLNDPELKQRANNEVAAREAYDRALGSGDQAKIEEANGPLSDAVKATDDIIKPRGAQLEKRINDALAAEGLPPVKVDIAGALDGDASFSFDADGNPRISISRRTLVTSSEAKLQELINHEADHYLQVVLQGRRVRELAENGGAALDPNNPADLERFKKAYAEHMQKNEGGGPRGGMPSNDYLLSLMKGEPLSEQQRVLADRLLAAAKSGAPVRADSIETANLFGQIENKKNPLEEQIKLNEQAGVFNRGVIDEILDPSKNLLTRREWDQNPDFTEAKIDEIRKTINSDTASVQEKNAKARELWDILDKRQRDINDWRVKAQAQYNGPGQIDELFADVAGAAGRAAAGEGRFGPDIDDPRIFDVGDAQHIDGWSRSADGAPNPNNPYASSWRADLDLRNYELGPINGNYHPFDRPVRIDASGRMAYDNPNALVRIEAGPNGPRAVLNNDTGRPVVIRERAGGAVEIPIGVDGVDLRPGDKIRVAEGSPVVDLKRRAIAANDVVVDGRRGAGVVERVDLATGDAIVVWKTPYDIPPGPTRPGPGWTFDNVHVHTPGQEGTTRAVVVRDPESGRYYYADRKDEQGRMIGAPVERVPQGTPLYRPGEYGVARRTADDLRRPAPGADAPAPPQPTAETVARVEQLAVGDRVTIDNHSGTVVNNSSERGVTIFDASKQNVFQQMPRGFERDIEAVNPADAQALQRLINGQGRSTDQIRVRSKSDPSKEFIVADNRGEVMARRAEELLPEGWDRELGRYEFIRNNRNAPSDRLDGMNDKGDMVYDRQTGKYYNLLPGLKAELAPEFRTYSRDAVARSAELPSPAVPPRPADAPRPAEAAQPARPEEPIARPRDASARPADAAAGTPASPPLKAKAASDWIGNKYQMQDINGVKLFNPDGTKILRNEDAHWLSDDGDVAFVIDGVGGGGGGDVASGIVKDTARARYPSLPKDASADEAFQWLDDTLRESEAKIREVQQQARENGIDFDIHPLLPTSKAIVVGQRPDGTDIIATKDMGAAVVGAVRRGDQLLIAHAGDSRAYVYRDGKLIQLTKDDHTPGTPRNHINNALGRPGELRLNHNTETIQPGDRFLLATDGLTDILDEMPPAEIEAIFRDNPDADSLNKALMKLAQDKAAKGAEQDNTTIMVLDY